MKSIVFSGICIFITILFFSGKKFSYSFQPPSGYSGVNGFSCNLCHSSFPLNSGGGDVVVNGLPLTGYTPGQSYPLSVTISHGMPDRTRWGFALRVVNGNGSPVGKFVEGPGTAIISDVFSNDTCEIAHSSAATPAAGSSYTYTGLSWVAPQTPVAGDDNISFYAAGNAANFNGSTDGDYIYNRVYAGISLPVQLSAFTALVQDNRQVLLQWQTEQETNSSHFLVERSYDGSNFTATGRIEARGTASTTSRYQFTDANPLQFNKPIQYRLKMVDKDSRFQYSPIQSVQLTGRQTVLKNISPNPVPAGREIAVEIAAWRTETASIEIIAANGSRVLWQQAALNTGYNRLPLARSSGLKPGVYTVILRAENSPASQRLTVQ